MSSGLAFEVLTSESIVQLRNAINVDPIAIWRGGLEALKQRFKLEFVDVGYVIDPSVQLEMPTPGRSGGRLSDAANAERILGAFPGLNAATATDERLWTTAVLGPFHEYSKARWEFEENWSEQRKVNFVREHAFAATPRDRERNNAVSRLWWSGEYIRRVRPDDLKAGLQALFHNSDIQVQLLGRPNISASDRLGQVILELVSTHLVDTGRKYHRPDFRGFLQALDLASGRKALGALPESVAGTMIEELFLEHHSS